MKDKILIIGPGTFSVGGISEYINNLMNSHLKENYNFQLLNTFKIKDKSLKSSISMRNIFNLILNILDLTDNIILNKPRLIHIHTSSYWGFWEKSVYVIIAKLMGIKVILHIHGGGFKKFYDNSHNTLKYIIRFVLERTDLNIVLTSNWLNYFKNIAPAGRYSVSSNYVNIKSVIPETVEEFFKQYPLFSNKFIILYIGSLSEEKGVEDILNVIRNLRKEKKILFVICGFGPLKGKVEKLENESSNFIFWGKISEPQRSILYSISQIFILPSYYEGLPMVLLESMSYKNAIISTGVGGIPDLIKNKYNGILIKPGNVDELQEAIITLFKNKKLLDKLQNNAFKTIMNKYDWEKGSIYIDKFYKKVING